MDRSELLCKLQSVININGHILGVAMGNGMVARYAVQSQADLLLAMSAGRFRQMGQSAFSAFFGYTDTNRMIIDFATKEILPVAGNSPVICGIFMQDPTIRLYDFFKETKEYGFSGVINYPTVCCMDGNFRNALEQAGLGYDKEIEGIRLAHFLGLFTIAYVFDKEEAVEMAKAGADVICVHMGITGGGMLGATRVISMESAIEKAKDISDAITKINPQIIKTACSGPIQTPIEAQIFYKNTGFQGIFVGSAVERLPVEHAVLNTIKAFKSPGDFDEKNIISQVLNGQEKNPNYAEFIQTYIQKNYQRSIRLKDISVITHMSVSRLSVLFKEKNGISFSQYLIQYRIKKACEYLSETNRQIKEISALVGYDDYTQFVKIFKKNTDMTPLEYRKIHQNK